MAKTPEDKAYDNGLERGRADCEHAKSMIDEAVDDFLEIISLGLIKEPDSVTRAREGGFAFGQENPPAQEAPEEPADSGSYDSYEPSYDSGEDSFEEEIEAEPEPVEAPPTEETISPKSKKKENSEFNLVETQPGWNYLLFVETKHHWWGTSTVTTNQTTAFYLDETTQRAFLEKTDYWPPNPISTQDAEIMKEISEEIYGKAPLNFQPGMTKLLIDRGIDPESEQGKNFLESFPPPQPPTKKLLRNP